MRARRTRWTTAEGVADLLQGALALACVAGWLWPEAGAAVARMRVTMGLSSGACDVSGWALMLMMISAGARVRVPEVRRLWSRWQVGLGAVAVIALVVPALAIMAGHVASKGLDDAAGEELRFGFLCMALAPVAFTSAFWVQHNGGNGAVMLAGMMLTAVGAGWSLPALGVSADGVFTQLLFLGLLPWLFGFTLRHALPSAARWLGWLTRVLGSAALLVSVWTQVSQASPSLVALPVERVWPVVVAVVVFNAAAFGVGFLASRTLNLLRNDAVALTFLSGMRAADVALVLAVATVPFSPWVALPAAVFTVSQQLLAGWITRHARYFESEFWRRTLSPGPGSLRLQLEKLYAGGPISRVGGVTLLVFEISGHPVQPRSRFFEEVVLPLTQRLRCTDFVSELPRDRFALVCLNTQPTAAEVIARKVKDALPSGTAARWGVCHSSWVSGPEQLVTSALGAVALFDEPKTEVAARPGSGRWMSASGAKV